MSDWTPGSRPSSPSCCSSRPDGWPATPPGSAPSLEEFVGSPAYNADQLRQDLDRFTFLPGADDGESLFGPDTAE
jgi:hypothetical protein